MAHNTIYRNSLKCSTTEVFHGRIRYISLDLHIQNPEKRMKPKFMEVNLYLDKTNFGFRENAGNIIITYHKYKTYYDRKARDKQLKVTFVFLLDPKHDSLANREVLSHSSYIIRNTQNAMCTQDTPEDF